MRLIILLLSLVACLLPLSAQNGLEEAIGKRVRPFFEQYRAASVETGPCRLDSVRLDPKEKTLTLYANDRFAYQPFRPETTEAIYNTLEETLKDILPRSVRRRYELVVKAEGQPIEELVPNYYRTRKKDKARLYDKRLAYKGEPWVACLSRPYQADRGLDGRHLVLWQSHGRYYMNDKDKWGWQRPRLFCTNEDQFTQSFVVPYLLPMLENAGAYVFTPRERDIQRNEVVVDNDTSVSARSSLYIEQESKKSHWQTAPLPGFAQRKATYQDGENPFRDGTARFAPTEKKADRAFAEWVPDLPEAGRYAVYVSYLTLPQSVSDAKYLVFHNGGVTEFQVNQQMGGGTWVYLGTFEFDQGQHEHNMVVLTNESKQKGVVCADAVRFGGGMGNIERGGHTSSLPRYLEGARYAAQWSGMPASVYGRPQADNDYADDINVRSYMLNYLSGGSPFNPQEEGLGVPFEMSFALHSDAGVSSEDQIIGSLGIYTTRFNRGQLAAGTRRMASRDLSDLLLSQLEKDIRSNFNVAWTRRSLWDRNYSETRLPAVPSAIVEMLSHQNFADMRLGHDPNFKFTASRAIYKGILRFLCNQHGQKYIVQPLPVTHFALQFTRKRREIELTWQPASDPQEPTAEAEAYIVYTRIGRGGFDNGVKVKDPSYSVRLEPGIVYLFRVTAINRGGESFPSETLAAYCAPQEKARIMIVNGFDRVSGPAVVNTPRKAGFDLTKDPGVPYLYDISICGAQTDFDREHAGSTLGESGDEWEGFRRAGNTFDYPFIHGKAIQANGLYSFVSCSDEAVEDGQVTLEDYQAVDYILGLEKDDSRQAPFRKTYYKTFPAPMRRALTSYCQTGGNLLISGAYTGSDMQGEGERTFTTQVLKYTSASAIRSLDQTLKVNGSGCSSSLRCQPNPDTYAVPTVDCLTPVAAAFTAMTYNDGQGSAAIAYPGTDYRTYVMGFPLESIAEEAERAKLMGAVLRFLMEP